MLPSKIIQNWKRIKEFSKQNLEFITTKLALQEILKGIFKWKKSQN